MRAAVDASLVGVMRSLDGKKPLDGVSGRALVRCCVLMTLLDLRRPEQVVPELTRSAEARWFVGAGSKLPAPSAIAKVRRLLDNRKDARSFLVLVTGLLEYRALTLRARAARQARIGKVKTRGGSTDWKTRVHRGAAKWSLTPRQAEVLGALARGLSNHEIAEELSCAAGTIELHVTALIKKSGAAGRANLVARFWIEL